MAHLAPTSLNGLGLLGLSACPEGQQERTGWAAPGEGFPTGWTVIGPTGRDNGYAGTPRFRAEYKVCAPATAPAPALPAAPAPAESVIGQPAAGLPSTRCGLPGTKSCSSAPYIATPYTLTPPSVYPAAGESQVVTISLPASQEHPIPEPREGGAKWWILAALVAAGAYAYSRSGA